MSALSWLNSVAFTAFEHDFRENKMTRTIPPLLALAINALCPCTALAQSVELPKWDFSSSVGILDAGHREEMHHSLRV